MFAWRFSGTFPGLIRKRLGFARGNVNCSMDCSAPILLVFTRRRTAIIFWRRSTAPWNPESSGSALRLSAKGRTRSCGPSRSALISGNHNRSAAG